MDLQPRLQRRRYTDQLLGRCTTRTQVWRKRLDSALDLFQGTARTALVNESINNRFRTSRSSKGSFLAVITLLILIGLPEGSVVLRAADVTKPVTGSPAEK